MTIAAGAQVDDELHLYRDDIFVKALYESAGETVYSSKSYTFEGDGKWTFYVVDHYGGLLLYTPQYISLVEVQ